MGHQPNVFNQLQILKLQDLPIKITGDFVAATADSAPPP